MDIAQEMVHEMRVGERFESHDGWLAFFNKWEQEQKQKYWTRDSKLIESVSVKRSLKPSLVYYKLWMHCIHGGIKFKSKGKGERQTSTHKMDCDAHIKLLASKDGQALEITSVNLKHENHDLSQEAFNHLPQNRRLAKSEKEEAQKLLKLGCNKKLLQNKIAAETGKQPTLKDLTNLRSAMKGNDENDLARAVELLKTKYHASVFILRNEDNEFKALYISTQDMKDSMEAWPEIVSIDGTYKLFAQGFTLMLNLVEDSDGLSEIVAVCFMVNEDRETFRFFLETFKRENPEAAKKIKCFMSDKDLLERDVLKEIFGVPVYICLFHTLKTFSRQITSEKMKITAQKREEILRLLQDLVYSKSESDYDEKYAELSIVAPESVLDYFDRNWHSIRDEWTVFSMVHGNLNNLTNNRLESINNKIKQVVPKNSSLHCFIEYFFEWLSSHKFERNHKAAQHVLKRPVTVHPPSSAEYRYLEFLTGYAYRYVLSEINKSALIPADAIAKDDATCRYSVTSRSGVVSATSESCQCGSWQSMMLPCEHIFGIRRLEKLDLFDERLCEDRWTRAYYLNKQRAFRSDSSTETVSRNSPAPVVMTTQPKRSISLTEKRKRAQSLASALVNFASLAPEPQFLCKLDVLKAIGLIWRDGDEVAIQRIPTTSQTSRSLLGTTSETVAYENGDSSSSRFNDDLEVGQESEQHEKNLGSQDSTTNRRKNASPSIVEPIPSTTKSYSRCSTPDSGIETLWLPVIQEENLTDLDDVDSILINEILNSERSFNLAEYVAPSSKSSPETLRGCNATTENEGNLIPTEYVASTTKLSHESISGRDLTTKSDITGQSPLVPLVPLVPVVPLSGAITDTVTPNINNMAIAPEVGNKCVETNDVAGLTPSQTLRYDSADDMTASEKSVPDGKDELDEDMIKQIVMPSSIRVRGRPRGATLTVIGVKPKKRTVQKKGPIAFQQRSNREKIEILLGWCVSEHIIPNVMRGTYLVRECDVEMRPEKIDMAILDCNIDLNLLKTHVEKEAFQAIISAVEIKRKTAIWSCSVCTKEAEEGTVQCDACIKWFHFRCVGLKRAPRKSIWFCPMCSETE